MSSSKTAPAPLAQNHSTPSGAQNNAQLSPAPTAAKSAMSIAAPTHASQKEKDTTQTSIKNAPKIISPANPNPKTKNENDPPTTKISRCQLEVESSPKSSPHRSAKRSAFISGTISPEALATQGNLQPQGWNAKPRKHANLSMRLPGRCRSASFPRGQRGTIQRPGCRKEGANRDRAVVEECGPPARPGPPSKIFSPAKIHFRSEYFLIPATLRPSDKGRGVVLFPTHASCAGAWGVGRAS